MDISKLTMDESAERVLYVGDFYVDVAPMGCRAYDEKIKELTKPLRRKRKGGRITESEMEVFIRTAIACVILTGWDGLSEGGKPVPYSVEKAENMFTENYQFYKRILDIAGEIAAERSGADEAAEGNSKTASSGNSSTAAS